MAFSNIVLPICSLVMIIDYTSPSFSYFKCLALADHPLGLFLYILTRSKAERFSFSIASTMCTATELSKQRFDFLGSSCTPITYVWIFSFRWGAVYGPTGAEARASADHSTKRTFVTSTWLTNHLRSFHIQESCNLVS